MKDSKKVLQTREKEHERGIERSRAARVFTPAVDIVEQKDYVVLLADMPGVDENTVSVTLDKDLLTIYGSVEPEIHEGHRPVISEYEIGDYERSFTISNGIDRNKIIASVKDGLLRLTLPRAATAGTRKIPVTGNA